MCIVMTTMKIYARQRGPNVPKESISLALKYAHCIIKTLNSSDDEKDEETEKSS